MTPDVVSVKTLPSYLLEAEFENGEVRRFDMSPYLKYPAFAPLITSALFEKAHVEHGTIVWTDEIDFSPDTLYLLGEKI